MEGPVFSEYYPGRSRAKIINIDEDKHGGYGGREEPQVKARNNLGYILLNAFVLLVVVIRYPWDNLRTTSSLLQKITETVRRLLNCFNISLTS